MRISDWSSDVCSSDLQQRARRVAIAEGGDAGDVRRGGAKGGDGGGNVGAARLETAVATVAVADTAAVETQDGRACRGDPLAEHRPAAVRDRKSVLEGTRVGVRVDRGGLRQIQNKK